MKFSEISEAVASTDGKYLKLKEGENPVRIVSEPIQVWKVYAGKDTRTITDPAAEKPKDAKMVFAMYVIDRKDGQVKIAEFGRTIMKQIADLRSSKEYAFEELPPYDMTIQKGGSGMETVYKVYPARMNSQISPEESAKFLSMPPLEAAYKA